MDFSARHWIDGEPAGDPTVDSLDPASGERVGRFADGSRADAEAAIGSARRAFTELKHIYQAPGVVGAGP